VRWPALAAVLPVLPSPPTADAHIRSGVVATEYRVSVSPLPPALSPGVTARVYEGDRALGLTVAGDHSVIVLGYAGEPFLRIDSAGVAVNEASPTAVAVGFVDQRRRVRGPSWNAQSSEPAAAWHDRRLDGLRAGVERGRWAIPLVLDGEVVQLEGEIRRVPAPSPWPWVVVAGAFGVATALLLVARRPQLIRPAAVGFGALSVHEVAIDPTPGKKLAFVSYYAGGFRILKYDNNRLTEVGAFIDQGGNDFWGVEVHNIGNEQYVLASDRDFGLYIFQPDV